MSAKNWQITLNQVDKWEDLKAYLMSRKMLNYAVACHEIAPSTGHEHIHCYCQFSSCAILAKSKTQGAHIEKCKGTPQQNVEYIKKDGDVIWEYGSIRMTGNPTAREIKKMTEDQLEDLAWNQYIGAKKIRAEHDIQMHKENPYIKTPDVQWHFGGTGSGKSYYAKNNNYTSITYDGSKYEDWEDARKIQFEEFRGNIPWSELLKITDKYHNTDKLRILYGHKYIDFDAIYIASSKPPWEVYPNREKNDDIKQLMRRMKWVVYEHRWYDGEFEYRLWRYNLEDDEPCVIQDWEPWIVECTIPNYDEQ